MTAMDISPVIESLREWAQNSSLTVKQITAKLCWMLSVSGFFHARNIHMIEEQRRHIEKWLLNLVLYPLKKKEVTAQFKAMIDQPPSGCNTMLSKCVNAQKGKGEIQSLPNPTH
ncbi:hypothetical protein AYI70_g4563 [Smittium culicis]|uniref:Uncharacterized protein n=1 Tax=Smittium culicis TaxID=133412 RepID=A0A1R1XYC4_9FUNG|nr:hypothetical protein AYI70_g4563 [Smittium culicis]